MEENCVMRDESAPLLHSKQVAAAAAAATAGPALSGNVVGNNGGNKVCSKSKHGNKAKRCEKKSLYTVASKRCTRNCKLFAGQHPNTSVSSSSSSSYVTDDSEEPHGRPIRKFVAMKQNLSRNPVNLLRMARTNPSYEDWIQKFGAKSLLPPRCEKMRRHCLNIRNNSWRLPVAPYNTTQFLMEEHQDEVDEEDLFHPCGKYGDNFNYWRFFAEASSFEEDEYLHAQFCAEYDSVALERLHAMSKVELVHEYLSLEARIDSLEDELKVLEKAKETDQPMEISATAEDLAKINVFQQEISKLLRKNRRMKMENDVLQEFDHVSARTAVELAAARAAAVEQEEECILVDDQ